MNIQRFVAPTSREALARARMTFGDGTLILSNRPTEHGVEVVATGEDTLATLDRNAVSTGSRNSGGLGRERNAGKADPKTPMSYKDVASQVEEDANQLAMSTLSFQDYVRERMARRRAEEGAGSAGSSLIRVPRDELSESEATNRPAARQNIPAAPAAETAELRAKAAPVIHRSASHEASQAMPHSIERELHAMKELIEDRFNTLNWLGQARQNPIQSNLMLKLIRSGYSPLLARSILERMPETGDAASSMQWVMDVLERNLHTDEGEPALHDEGGVFALVGSTGVGKTTTAAKLAGLCARQYGSASVGLITLDSYRVGAQEQLRAYGKMLGVVAHLAHDREALQDLLNLLSGKKMVLIDTTGLAPRDPRKNEVMDLIDMPSIKRLLVLNAGNHGDTLEDTITAFKTSKAPQAILSKIDEAVKLGPALDASIRHQLTLRGVTTGQRVPEDWEAALPGKLVRASMRSQGSSAYDPKMNDLGFLFSHSAEANGSRGALHA